MRVRPLRGPRRDARPPSRVRSRADRSRRGQATLLVAAGLALAMALIVGLATLGRGVVDAAEARTAADAAALAGAADGPDAAARLARANGASVEGYRVDGVDVTVTVVVGRARATARARREGTWCRTDTLTGRAISYTDPPCPSTPG